MPGSKAIGRKAPHGAQAPGSAGRMERLRRPAFRPGGSAALAPAPQPPPARQPAAISGLGAHLSAPLSNPSSFLKLSAATLAPKESLPRISPLGSLSSR